MDMKSSFRFEAVSCLLSQGGLQSPLRTLAIRIANAARLLGKLKVAG